GLEKATRAGRRAEPDAHRIEIGLVRPALVQGAQRRARGGDPGVAALLHVRDGPRLVALDAVETPEMEAGEGEPAVARLLQERGGTGGIAGHGRAPPQEEVPQVRAGRQVPAVAALLVRLPASVARGFARLPLQQQAQIEARRRLLGAARLPEERLGSRTIVSD